MTQNSVLVVLQSHVTNQNHISSTRVPMPTKLGRMVTYFERLRKSHFTLWSRFCKVTWQTKIIIWPQLVCLWLQTWQNDNLRWLVPTYIKLHHPLITMSCKITWQTKTIISPLAQCIWPPNLLGWWYTLSGS